MRYFKKQSLKNLSFVFIFGFFTLNIIFFLLLQYPSGLFQFENNMKSKKEYYPDPIDIVYTWVNGSDPELIRDLTYHKLNLYLDRSMELGRQVNRLNCPFENCGFNDHFFLSPIPIMKFDHNVLIKSLSMKIGELLNSSDVNITFINQIDRSIYSSKTGFLFQSSKSLSNLFINHSQFTVELQNFYKNNFTISKILVAATNSTMGYPVEDHIFLTGFAEMRDTKTEDNWRRAVAKQLPNNTKIIKSSATGFLLVLPDSMNIHQFYKVFNSTKISSKIHISKCVLLVDVNLVTIMSDLLETRFQDNDELKYSLRSLEKFVGFFRHIFIVTNGQIPSWLNADHPEITIIPHSLIFPNKSNLPTFNSAAIEANLHNIPGLAPHFLYLNDDVFFGRNVYPEDFYSPSSGYKVYLGWSVPDCAENCPNSWLADGFCDHDCNVPECEWDAGDCLKTPGKTNFINFHSNSNQSFPKLDNIHSIFSGMGVEFCSHGCNNIWLADRYCDQACNVNDCGYDLGDCGDRDIITLPSSRITLIHDQVVVIPNDTKSFVINLKEVIQTNDNVSQVTIDDSNEVLSSSYAIKYRLIIILFKKPEYCKNCFSKVDKLIHLNITLVRGINSHINIRVNMMLNPSKMEKSSRIESTSNPGPTTFSSISHLTSVDHEEIISNMSLLTYPPNKNISIERLEWERPVEMTHYRLLLHDGLISLEGYHHLVQQLFHSPLEHRQQDLRITSLPNMLRIESMPWGFLPWEKTENDFENLHTVSSLSSVSSMRRLLDLYAESLRYSNKKMSEVFSSVNKRVPAHGPHFITNTIYAEAHKKFYYDWVQTSAHRFRSPNDLQFAFTYFSFLMNVNKTVPLVELLHSVDTDYSGSLSGNELRSLILRIHTNETVSPSFINQTIYDIYNSCVISIHKDYGLNLTLMNINISDLIACFNWTQLYTPKSVPRFQHTNHEANDLAFIMISANFENIMKNLDWLRKSPKKFFCLNDNLANSGDQEAVSKIRVEVKNFLDFMFPVPSKYEAVSKKSTKTNLTLSLFILMIGVVALILFLLPILTIFRKFLYFLRQCLLHRTFAKRCIYDTCIFDDILIKS